MLGTEHTVVDLIYDSKMLSPKYDLLEGNGLTQLRQLLALFLSVIQQIQ